MFAACHRIAGMMVLLGVLAPAWGQSPKVCIVNPARVFNEIQETRDLKAKMENELKSLDLQRNEKQAKIRDAQTARDVLKPDSPQYEQKNRELMQMAIEFDTWAKMTQNDINRVQKQQMKAIFDKITNAVGTVATAKGIDLVIAEMRPEMPESLDQIDVNQLRLLINQRNILYNSSVVDISSDVIATMDAEYKAGR